MNTRSFTTVHRLTLMIGAGLLALAAACSTSQAYERYNDGCQTCHGSFTGSTSPQGTVFPNGDKHRMHRNSSNMGTDCALCHRSDDDDNPFLGSSDGIGSVPGLGCMGCHVGAGLRKHHATTGTLGCYTGGAGCHGTGPETVPAENVSPPYYGTPYTKANNPGNTVLAANTNENWSVGDFLGVDNDGNNLYDLADYAVGPFQILSTTKEGNDVRITWLTARGRRDAVQASTNVAGSYANVSPIVSIPGVGVVTTNYLEVNGALESSRFYRMRYMP